MVEVLTNVLEVSGTQVPIKMWTDCECRFSEQNSFMVDKVPDLGLPLRNANDDVLYVGPILEFRSW